MTWVWLDAYLVRRNRLNARTSLSTQAGEMNASKCIHPIRFEDSQASQQSDVSTTSEYGYDPIVYIWSNQ